MSQNEGQVFLPLNEWFDREELPVSGILPDSLSDLYRGPMVFSENGKFITFPLLLPGQVALRVPGIEQIALVIGSGEGFLIHVVIDTESAVAVLETPLLLSIDANLLRPLKPDSDEPDPSTTTLDIDVGTTVITLTEGNVSFSLQSAASIPSCMVGTTGVILEIGAVRWLTPSIPDLPAGVPEGFTGLHLDDVRIRLKQLPQTGKITMDDVFIGTGGISGKVNWDNTGFQWNNDTPTGPATGKLLGFDGGLIHVSLELKQSSLVECEITAEIFVPYLKQRIGLALGLDGNGGIHAIAAPARPQGGQPVASPQPGYLLHLDVGEILQLDVGSIRIDASLEKASLELSGRATIALGGFNPRPTIDFKSLRINSNGHVEVDGGWVDVGAAVSCAFHGFPLEITRIGFGTDDGEGRWIGLNGAFKLADGLPAGGSVEGLRISLEDYSISLEGVAVEMRIPGTLDFKGKVSFVKKDGMPGFSGDVKLHLEAVQLTLDARLDIRRHNDDTYFYLLLNADLPSGIPLFTTGAALYGFSGLIATNMTADRTSDEDWYQGWYLREPKGAAATSKWRVQHGAFAAGIGTTIGTAFDDGYALNTKTMLILLMPGPRLLLHGKGSFLRKRQGDDGQFDALLQLDMAARLFQANLAASYSEHHLLSLRGDAKIGFSWADPPPQDMWHVYLGEREPLEKRWQAQLLGLFDSQAYLQINRTAVALGARIGIDDNWSFGPARASLKAVMEGDGEVSWAPTHFKGEFHIDGHAELSAFGFGVGISLDAAVQGSGPTPWRFEIKIHLSIEIDLWLFSFSLSVDLPLKWSEAQDRLPSPVQPLVAMIGCEHPKISEAWILSNPGAVVPPDARPVIVFNRPVNDVGGVGLPNNPVPRTDEVGPAKFKYELTQVMLIESSRSRSVLVAASGIADIRNRRATLPGVTTLPSAAGLTIEIGERSFEVTDVNGGVLTIPSCDLSDGRHAYRLKVTQKPMQFRVTSVRPGPNATFIVTTDRADLRANAFAGGTLAASGMSWLVLGNTINTVVARGDSDPPTGPASLTWAPAPILEGVWLKTSDGQVGNTKLMLSARTPFAWFRYSDRNVVEGFGQSDPRYACGPTPEERPLCVNFDNVGVGALGGPFLTTPIQADAGGDVICVGNPGGDRHVAIGKRFGGDPSSGSVQIQFTEPVERIWLTYASGKSGSFVVRGPNGVVGTLSFAREPLRIVTFAGAIDFVEIQGRLVDLYSICFSPGWTCIHFEAQSFPQDSTGEQSYAGLLMVTDDVMSVFDDMLIVKEPGRTSDPRFAPSSLERLAKHHGVILRGGHGSIAKGVQPADRNPRLVPGSEVVLSVVLPEPVTRVLIDLVDSASVRCFADTTVVATIRGGAGAKITLDSETWIDRIEIRANDRIRIRTICHDGAAFGWQRFEQWSWQNSVRESIESFYRTSSVLRPGAYELRVTTGWTDQNWRSGNPTNASGTGGLWVTDSVSFMVGKAPGLEAGSGEIYPGGGPLSSLGTYVEKTLPQHGEKPFYRSYDVGIGFNENYISRLYLESAAPLSVSVVDTNRVDRRPNAPNLWAAGPELGLSVTDEVWIAHLHGDGTDECANVDTNRIVRNEQVIVGSGDPFAPNQLHRAEVRAPGRALFAFEFVTSAFVNFAHHMATFDGQYRSVGNRAYRPGTDEILRRQQYQSVLAENAFVNHRFVAARDALNSTAPGTPTAQQFHDFAQTKVTLVEMSERLISSRHATFEFMWNARGLASPPLPRQVEISAVAGGALIESPEPIAWDRLRIKAAHSRLHPYRQKVIWFDRSFGSPPAGRFKHAGLDWVTDAELRVDDGLVTTRNPARLKVSVKLPRARQVEVALHGITNGFVTVGGDGVLDAPIQIIQPQTVCVLKVEGTDIAELRLEGKGFAIESISFAVPFEPTVPEGAVRIRSCKVPGSGSPNHSIEIIAMEETHLDGWKVLWFDATNPKAPLPYHTFGEGVELKEAEVMSIHGGGKAPPNRPFPTMTRFGGTFGLLSAGGIVFQLIDPNGNLVHEVAAFPDQAVFPSFGQVVPNRDQTRAFLMHADGLAPGYWRLEFVFDHIAGPSAPILSIAGKSTFETAAISFNVP